MQCIMQLNPERLQIVVTSDSSDGMQLWSGVLSQTLFDSYLVESLNNNVVAFELQVENLEQALKSAQFSTTECLCKLSKKNGNTYLTFVLEMQTAQVMNVVQDVPVRLLTPAQVSMLTEPVLPDPTVHILLPSLKQIKPIVDRLKKLDDVLVIECNMDGTLKMGVMTDQAKITCVMTGLDHPKVEGQGALERNPDLWCTARVDMKKFCRFLGAQHVNPGTVVCCLIPHKAVVCHVILDQAAADTFYMTYYLPLVV
jgi:HUS1 checkpoint protein